MSAQASNDNGVAQQVCNCNKAEKKECTCTEAEKKECADCKDCECSKASNNGVNTSLKGRIIAGANAGLIVGTGLALIGHLGGI